MPDVEIKLPSLGEDAPEEARLSFFFVEPGDELKEGDEVCEMVTDKATFSIPAPCSGVLKKVLVKEDQAVKVGQTLAIVETQ